MPDPSFNYTRVRSRIVRNSIFDVFFCGAPPKECLLEIVQEGQPGFGDCFMEVRPVPGPCHCNPDVVNPLCVVHGEHGQPHL